jgi:hypothetical protein
MFAYVVKTTHVIIMGPMSGTIKFLALTGKRSECERLLAIIVLATLNHFSILELML